MKKAVIFDLDGVLATTDEYHYLAWKEIADREGIPFDRSVNEKLRGVSRMECLDIILGATPRVYSEAEKVALATDKNTRYQAMLGDLSPAAVLPGVLNVLVHLKAAGIRTAVGSSSRNARLILAKTGLIGLFDAIADGTMISRSKPDPEVFLLAAKMIGVAPDDCVVVEDAEAGIDAARAAGMTAVGVGLAGKYRKAHLHFHDLGSMVDIAQLIGNSGEQYGSCR